ncbi:hypothetical protein C8J57DRAFT_1538767 [Mycena rebaudengoi]|nr:hypothetical protein C8J57DRAFT_1538767 [Mycena rebaudengoi]
MDAATAAREAKAIHAGLKVLLACDAWEAYKETDFQRKKRVSTSYAFIALYKARIASKSNNKHTNNSNNNNMTVETRNILQRFR